MRVKNENILSTASADLSANWTSRAIWLGHIANYTIQITFTGSPVGTFTLEISSDDGNIQNQSLSSQEVGVLHWTPINGSTQAVVTAGSHAWEFADTGANWVRVKYARTSGTGTVTSARCYVKGV